MTQTGYWYTTASSAVPSAIWHLISTLGQSNPDGMRILVPNRALKFDAMHQLQAGSMMRQPLVYTLDEWVVRQSGLVRTNSSVQDAVLDQWMATKLADLCPTILFKLPGVRASFRDVFGDTIRFQKRREWAVQLLQSRYITASADDVDTALSAIANFRIQLGKVDRLDAYATRPVSPDIETLVLIGLNPIYPIEWGWLDQAVLSSKSVMVVAPSWAKSEWNRRLKSSLCPTEINVGTNESPTVTQWQCDSAAQQGELVTQLVQSERQQSDFDGARVVVVVDSPGQVAIWNRLLNQTRVSCMATGSVPIAETDIGRLILAWVGLGRSKGKWQMVRDVLEIAYRLGWYDGMSPAAQLQQFQVWVRSAVVLMPRWWTRSCPEGGDPSFWDWIHTHITPILDQSGVDQLVWLVQTIQTVSQAVSHRTPVSAWEQWAMVNRLLNDCLELARRVPPIEWASVIQDAIQSETIIGAVNPRGVRVLTLRDAATVSADAIVITAPTSGHWGVSQTGLKDPLRRAKLGLGSDLDRIKTELLALFQNAARAVHWVSLDTPDGGMQSGSGLIGAIAHSVNGGGAVIRPHLPPRYARSNPIAIPKPSLARATYSVSRLSAYRVCPRQYALRYEHNATGISQLDWEWSAQEKGIVLHLIIEGVLTAIQSGYDPYRWLQTDGSQIVRRFALGIMGQILINRLIGNSDKPGLIWTIVPDLQQFCQTHHIIAIERPLSVWIPRYNRDPIQVTGVADVVARHIETGVGVVIDIKTSATPITASTLRRFDHLQLPVYRLGLGLENIPIHLGVIWQLGQTVTQRPVCVDEIGQAHIKSMFKNARPLRITPAFDSELMAHLEWVVNQIESGDFRTDGINQLTEQTQRRTACRTCLYTVGCPFEGRFKL